MESRFLSYTEALSLDTFLQILTFEQRLAACQYRAGHTDKVPVLVQKLQDWCSSTTGTPPPFAMTLTHANSYGKTTTPNGNR